jgi:hypothetical protein
MRIFSWRWVLPLLQIAVATAALVYAPSEWKARPHLIGDCTGVGRRATWPPPVLRMSYAVNFPALAASIPVRFAPWSGNPVIYHRQNPFIWVSVDDSVFLLGVGLLWYWLGAKLDRGFGQHKAIRCSRLLTVLKLTAGSLFSLGVAGLATLYATRSDADRPYKQIGPFCFIWAAVLLYYFGRKLVLAIGTPLRDSQTQ